VRASSPDATSPTSPPSATSSDPASTPPAASSSSHPPESQADSDGGASTASGSPSASGAGATIANADIEKLQSKNDVLSAERDDLKCQVQDRDRQIQRWRNAVSQKQEEIKALSQAASLHERTVRLLSNKEGDLYEANARIRNLEEQRKTLAARLRKKRAKIYEQNSQIAALESKVSALKQLEAQASLQTHPASRGDQLSGQPGGSSAPSTAAPRTAKRSRAKTSKEGPGNVRRLIRAI